MPLGRVSSSIENIANEIGANKYYISGNGAMLYDMENKKIIYENYIGKKKILELVKLCDENSIYYNIYTEDSVITKSLNYNVAFYNYENSKKSESKKTNINLIEDVYKYIEESNVERFLKVTICDSDKVIFSSIIRKLKLVEDIDVLEISHMSRKTIKYGTTPIDIAYFYTEITNKDVDKWTALEELMKLKNIKKEEVMAIGDNINDKTMIENAGLGIAMGQSTPKLIELAKNVTSDNNSNGVAEAINKHI